MIQWVEASFRGMKLQGYDKWNYTCKQHENIASGLQRTVVAVMGKVFFVFFFCLFENILIKCIKNPNNNNLHDILHLKF